MIGFTTFEKMAFLLSIICLLFVVCSFSLFPINLAGETYINIAVRLLRVENWPFACLFSLPLFCFAVAAIGSIYFKNNFASQFYVVLISLGISLVIFCFLFFYTVGIGNFNGNIFHLFFTNIFYLVISFALYLIRPRPC